MAVVALALAARVVAAEPPLQAVASRIVGADQGVYVHAEDGRVLASVAAARAVHPASVSKVATTLALLRDLGPAHRVTTRLAVTGTVRDGRADGDLVVLAAGDAFLVTEHAYAMAAALREAGVRRVAGRLRTEGTLLFDWGADLDGRRLAAALAGGAGPEAWARLRAARPELRALTLPEIALAIGGAAESAAEAPRVLVEHRSPALRYVVKALNGYSNNVFHLLADTIGGPRRVEAVAQSVVPPEQRDEIRLDNGAGAGTTNRLSPRAAVAILDALATELTGHGLDLTDVLPVSGIDAGTLRDRLDDGGLRGALVGKTGTYGSLGACALAGVVATQRWGRVTFAILNRDVAVPEARRRQDAFVRALVAEAGVGTLGYVPDPTSPVLRAETNVVR
jgi:D-alanyl-D-alanine carboxypeptidase/D-alanyl-D-alanine-endopeptidase (penicillin-binding protein 4)